MNAGTPTVRQEAGQAAGELAERPGRGPRSDWLAIEQIIERLPLAVDRVMGESGLWAPELAARALRQARGDVPAAVHLLRMHRSALPRLARSEPMEPAELKVTRRISSAFRDPPGGQLLGRTLDYVGRLLDLLPEEDGRNWAAREEEFRQETATGNAASAAGHPHHHDHGKPGHGHHHDYVHGTHGHDHGRPGSEDGAGATGGPSARVERMPENLLALLRGMGIVDPVTAEGDPEPFDITRKPVLDGAPRSAWLQMMARADTGSLMHMWYSSIFSSAGHEIPGEIRHGSLPVRVTHPYTRQPVTAAEVRVSEVQTFHSLGRAGELGTGYGLCFGHNDRKAISMAGIDLLLINNRDDSALHQEVLSTLDGMDATGYLQHTKLPHYVEFRSVAERAHAVADRAGHRGDGGQEGDGKTQ